MSKQYKLNPKAHAKTTLHNVSKPRFTNAKTKARNTPHNMCKPKLKPHVTTHKIKDVKVQQNCLNQYQNVIKSNERTHKLVFTIGHCVHAKQKLCKI